MNILLIGYCNLADGFLYAADALKKKNHNIYFFPYMSHLMDNVSNIDDILIKYINEHNIKICLWWCNSVKYNNYEYILNTLNNNIQHIFYNWDPFLYNYVKYNSFCWEDIINEKKKIYKLMNNVLSCFEYEISFFKNYLSIKYAPPGFDMNISKYLFDLDYECDVSIVCTNLYEDTYQFPNETTNITRYSIVNKLYENRDKIKFHIYGPEKFNNIYPDCYRGFINYDKCNKVFSNSKINLSIHPLIKELNSEKSKEEYFSERVPQILGCKGLLMTNSLFTDILDVNTDYIYIDDQIDWFEKMLEIVNNNEIYNTVRENGYNKAINHYKWDNWANIFESIII